MRITKRFATTTCALLATTGLVPAVAPQVAAAGAVGAVAAPPLRGLYASPAVHALPMAAASPSAPPTAAECEQYYSVTCYSPDQLETAYGTGRLFRYGIDGAGQTIVVVEPLGSPSVQSDLTTFDEAFGLPGPPSFQVIAPVGAPPAYQSTPADEAWAQETSLDVEWAHAMAPGARILLVETPVAETEGLAGFPQILAAENYVIDHHLGDVISQSFESTEETFPSPAVLDFLSSTYLNAYRHGVTVVSASGDNGVAGYSNPETTTFYPRRVVQWPASDPFVTSVGGTTLDLDSSGNRLAPDVAWNDTYNATVLRDFVDSVPPQPFASGGGASAVFPRPDYQDIGTRAARRHRTVPDISMNAGCTGPVDIYSAAVGGWFIVCGTSEAAPLFSGVVALADQLAGHSLGLVNPELYKLGAERAPGIVPIYQGNNTVSFPLTETAGTLTSNSATLTSTAATLYVAPSPLSAGSSSASSGSGTGGATSGIAAQTAVTLTGNAVTVTSNAVTIRGYSANGGYSMVTGLGTVDAASLVPELARASCPGWREGPSPFGQWSPLTQSSTSWREPWPGGGRTCGPGRPGGPVWPPGTAPGPGGIGGAGGPPSHGHGQGQGQGLGRPPPGRGGDRQSYGPPHR